MSWTWYPPKYVSNFGGLSYLFSMKKTTVSDDKNNRSKAIKIVTLKQI